MPIKKEPIINAEGLGRVESPTPEEMDTSVYQLLSQKGLSELDIKILSDALGVKSGELLAKIMVARRLMKRDDTNFEYFDYEAIDKLANRIAFATKETWLPVDSRYHQALENLRNLVS